MYHILAFEEDVGQTANTELDIVSDQIVNADSGQAYLEDTVKLVAAFAAGATITRARIVSPKLRQVFIPYVIPLNGAVTPATDPNVMDLRENPIVLRGLERFVPEHTSGVACGTERHYSVLVLQKEFRPSPSGEATTIRATGTTTAVQGTWVDVPLTWDQQIAAGRYAVVGGHCQGATMVAWRLIMDTQVFRPGGLGITALTNRTHSMFYAGSLGTWGHFRSTNLPRLQVLCNAGDTAQNLFLQVVRVGDT